MTGDTKPGPEILVVSDKTRKHHAEEIGAAMDLPPDVVFEVGHSRHCGDLGCTRPLGEVQVAVTWLTGELRFKASFSDDGHLICTQTVRRTQRKIEELLAKRDRHLN
jgi:hypothetical protein